MLLPDRISEVDLDPAWRRTAPYPPLGFQPFSDCELGNGDSFGLYWPIGHEAAEPLVVETWHDGALVRPTYSCLKTFLAARGRADDDFPEPPSLRQDPRSPCACFDAAKQAVAAQNVDAAIRHLERAVTVLSEYTEAQALLWSQYMRKGRQGDVLAVALKAVAAPPSFGARALKPLRWLRSLADDAAIAAVAAEHPLWRARKQLNLVYGGVKDNADYAVYRAAIQAHLDVGRVAGACVMMQTYGELLYAETVALQQREGFDPQRFVAWQTEVSALLPNGPRTVAKGVGG